MEVSTVNCSGLNIVGKGRFGTVCLQSDGHCRKIFSRQCLETMIREVFVVKILSDVGGITHILEFDPKSCSFVMPNYGVPLTRKINETNDNKLKYIYQLYSILASVHQKGIVHGDIKLENIIVDDRHVVTLVDWGSASISGNPRSSHSGTSIYSSRCAPNNCDMYSLALVTIELLTSTVFKAQPSYSDIESYIETIALKYPVLGPVLYRMVHGDHPSVKMIEVCYSLEIPVTTHSPLRKMKANNIDEYRASYRVRDVDYPEVLLKNSSLDSGRALILRCIYTSHPVIMYNHSLLRSIYDHVSKTIS